ncbi:MAG: TldD/PmbA family protein [Euryarchaeota archaeon]|nr:TldD/PmbA family protein [Euryarchaeota archaeon]
MIFAASRALECAYRAGADEVEVYCTTDRSVSINTKLEQIEYASESLTRGIGIRAIVAGAVGFSSTNDEKTIEHASELAVTSARASQPDQDWSSLPTRSTYPAVHGVFDSAIAGIELSRCVELAVEMIRGVTSTGATPTSGGLAVSTGTSHIRNTNGIEHTEEGTSISAFIECIVKGGAGIATAYDFDVSRSLDIDAFEVGRRAGELAKQSLHGGSIEPKKMTVLFGPLAIADILEYTFIPSLSADNVQKGRSMLSEVGAVVGAGELNITDDGLRRCGIGTAQSDDEGTPSQKTTILKDGILEGHLYDAYTAGKADADAVSTGNAVRSGYGATPTIGVRNLVLEYPASDVVAETTSGVLIHSVIGAHTANQYSGDFSIEARNSFLVENGAVTKPIKSIMIAGNIFDLLKKIDGAGTDVRAVGEIIVPTLRISDVQVIG